MHGFIDQIIEIRRRVSTENVGTGFTEQWESLGEFYGTVLEKVSSLASLQQQFSRYSLFTVKIVDGPRISYGNNLFYTLWKDGQPLLLRPERDPKRFGDLYRLDQEIECVDIYGLSNPDSAENTPSVNYPPNNPVAGSDTFTGDGTATVFMLNFPMAPSTSRVIVDHSYKLRNVDYFEATDRITFIRPPGDGSVISVKGDELQS